MLEEDVDITVEKLMQVDFHFLTEINRYRRICTKVDASFFDSALSHTHRSDALEKKRRK